MIFSILTRRLLPGVVAETAAPASIPTAGWNTVCNMSLPEPPVALDDVCAVVWNNTLYTYSQDAFQSLPLTPGGNWTQLPPGEKVTGAVCVGSTPADAAAAGFYVVGGNGTNPDYQGLQKYTYATGQWETITPEAHVTQQRLGHGAVYLNASDSILVYAGHQDGTQSPSTETFTIGASAPYSVISYQSSAPPSISPILLPWSDSEAVLVGGSTTNKEIFVFEPETSWVDSGASLADPLTKSVAAMQATLVTGDDGSKNLYTFDMTVSPNAVTRTVLINGQGQAVPNSAPISTRSESTRHRRSLTLSNWPEYNATLAPTVTRTDYALAQGANDMVVIAGGNQADPLCMFNGRENKWMNATAMLSDQKVFALDTTSTSTSTSASTSRTSSATPTSTSLLASTSSSATPTPTAAATPIGTAESGSSGLGTNTLLGIILGSVFGAAILLALIYLCIRRKRVQLAYLEAGHLRRASGVSSSEKDSIVFANDSLAHGLSGPGVFRGHHQQQSGNSFSSMAILMGKVNQQSPPSLKRNPSDQTKRSSSSSMFNKAFKSTISKPIPQTADMMAPAPPRPAPQSRDAKGVGFAPNTAAPRPRPSNAAGSGDKRDSTRRSSGWNRYWSGGSALNILGFGSGNAAAASQSKRITVESDRSSEYSNVSHHRITQDSATVPPLNVYEPRASFSRVTRGSPTISTYDKEVKEGLSGQIERPVSAVSDLSGYSSGIPPSVHEAWDPTTAQKPWGSDRAPSSAYASVYATSLSAAPAARPTQPPTGVSRQPQLETAATSSDMSWLNIGDNGGP